MTLDKRGQSMQQKKKTENECHLSVPLKVSKRMTFIGSGAPMAHDASYANLLIQNVV